VGQRPPRRGKTPNVRVQSKPVGLVTRREAGKASHESFPSPPEIAVGPLGRWRDITHVTAGLTAAVRVTSLGWTNEGFDEQG
jgi:hypothetical protein